MLQAYRSYKGTKAKNILLLPIILDSGRIYRNTNKLQQGAKIIFDAWICRKESPSRRLQSRKFIDASLDTIQ